MPIFPSRKEIKDLQDKVSSLESNSKSVKKSYTSRITKARTKIKSLEDRIAELEDTSRKGNTSYTTLDNYLQNIGWRPYKNLTLKQLWETYKKSSVIRACIDRITQAVEECSVIILPGKTSRKSDIEEAKLFFERPGNGYDDFPTLISPFVRDLLVYDIAICEKVYNSPKSRVLEINPLDASTLKLIAKKSGLVSKYEQHIDGTKTADFEIDEIMRLVLHPTTKSVNGQPIIDSIVDETATLMLSVDEIAKTFTEGKIPDGMLVLDSIGDTVKKRMKEAIRSDRYGRDRELFVLRAKNAEWLNFRRPFKEMQLAELRESIEKIVWRNFGFDPIIMGDTGSPSRSSITELKYAESRLVKPILRKIQNMINTQLIPDLGFRDILIKLVRPLHLDNIRDKTFSSSRLVGVDENGKPKQVMTVDEAREIFFELPPIEEEELE